MTNQHRAEKAGNGSTNVGMRELADLVTRRASTKPRILFRMLGEAGYTREERKGRLVFRSPDGTSRAAVPSDKGQEFSPDAIVHLLRRLGFKSEKLSPKPNGHGNTPEPITSQPPTVDKGLDEQFNILTSGDLTEMKKLAFTTSSKPIQQLILQGVNHPKSKEVTLALMHNENLDLEVVEDIIMAYNTYKIKDIDIRQVIKARFPVESQIGSEMAPLQRI